MKKTAIILLVLLMAFSLCACRMGDNTQTPSEPESTTSPTATNPVATDPIAEPTIIDPPETNIPDPNVDDDHLIDPTGDSVIDEAARDITRRINGLS